MAKKACANGLRSVRARSDSQSICSRSARAICSTELKSAVIAGFAQLNLYEERLLLRKFQGLALIIKGSTMWLAAYLALAWMSARERPP